MCDTESITEMRQQTKEWLDSVDKSGLPGSYKARCYQHGILPRLTWQLFIYDVPLSTVEVLERTISSYLRRWLNVPRSLSSIGLYSTGSKLQLPLSSLVEEYKVAKVRQAVMLRDSNDKYVSGAGIKLRSGRKWQVEEAVNLAEERLRQSDIIGTVTHGRLGLGCITRSRFSSASKQRKRELVQDEVRQGEEEARLTKAVAQKKQGSWLRWESVRAKKLPWDELWKMESRRIRFVISSVYDILPTPTNLCTWKLSEDPLCKLCGKRASLEHVLSACTKALADGRYTWRHNKVLEVLAHGIDLRMRNQRSVGVVKGPQFISFVIEAEATRGKQLKSTAGGTLATCNDWQMRADVNRQLAFPQHIAITNLRPDIVLWSQTKKKVVLIELTVPYEERVDEAHERKRLKYQELVEQCQDKEWKTWCFPVEVGCRGFPAQSVWRTLGRLGIIGKERKKIVKETGVQAEKASLWIWCKREEHKSLPVPSGI